MAIEKQFIEKRKHPRRLLYDNAYLTSEGGAYIGTIKNYSLGGIYITSNRAVNVGEVLSISLPRPENMGRMSIETTGVVRQERSGFALEFFESTKKTEKPAEPQDPVATELQ